MAKFNSENGSVSDTVASFRHTRRPAALDSNLAAKNAMPASECGTLSVIGYHIAIIYDSTQHCTFSLHFLYIFSISNVDMKFGIVSYTIEHIYTK